MNRRALGDLPVQTFISPGKTRLLTIALSAAGLLGRQAELSGLAWLLDGPGREADSGILRCSQGR